MLDESSVTIDYLELRERIADQFPLGRHSIHGPSHWERVDAWGQRLAASTQGADLVVVRLFAVFHDSQRFTECTDPLHGARGAAFARQVHGDWFRIESDRLRLLMQACERHEWGETSDDPTIGCCWDADRLDLPRVSIEPDPEFMSTAAGKALTRQPLR
jgi:uncharacterized protein